MNPIEFDSLADRLKTAADAKKALLAKFRTRASVTDPLFEQRAGQRAAALNQVREDRVNARAAKQQAIADARQAALDSAAAEAQAAIDAKRGDRKERKALSKAEAKAKRDARYAARKARR